MWHLCVRAPRFTHGTGLAEQLDTNRLASDWSLRDFRDLKICLRCQTGAEETSAPPAGGRCTTPRRSSVTASASTSAASSAWFAEKAWTAPRWRYTTRKSTANPATARNTVQKATATVRALGHSTWTEERDWASGSLRLSLTDRPRTQTRQNLPRNSEDQKNALGVGTLCTQQRGSWEQGSRGIRTASVALNVGRAWSPPHRRRRTERSTAKPATPRTSAPKDSATAKAPVLWSTLSDPTSIQSPRNKSVYIYFMYTPIKHGISNDKSPIFLIKTYLELFRCVCAVEEVLILLLKSALRNILVEGSSAACFYGYNMSLLSLECPTVRH